MRTFFSPSPINRASKIKKQPKSNKFRENGKIECFLDLKIPCV